MFSIILQTEIAKRLNAICAQIIPFLSQEVSDLTFQSLFGVPQDSHVGPIWVKMLCSSPKFLFFYFQHQQQVAAAVERAKQVTMTELNAIIGVSIRNNFGCLTVFGMNQHVHILVQLETKFSPDSFWVVCLYITVFGINKYVYILVYILIQLFFLQRYSKGQPLKLDSCSYFEGSGVSAFPCTSNI